MINLCDNILTMLIFILTLLWSNIWFFLFCFWKWPIKYYNIYDNIQFLWNFGCTKMKMQIVISKAIFGVFFSMSTMVSHILDHVHKRVFPVLQNVFFIYDLAIVSSLFLLIWSFHFPLLYVLDGSYHDIFCNEYCRSFNCLCVI